MNTFKMMVLAAGIAAISSVANASIKFTFSEVGSDVVMTSSGTLDTTKLIQTGTGGWGGVGIEQNVDGETDIMGSTLFGGTDLNLGFHDGTDQSAWLNPGGPWGASSFDWDVTGGSKSFATYIFSDSFIRNAGIGISSADVVGGLWTPDQSWINVGGSFGSLSLNVGTYTVSDALTGESITIQVGASVVPLPFGLPLLGSALLIGAIPAFRRRGLRPA